jgi:hypothetical protein
MKKRISVNAALFNILMGLIVAAITGWNALFCGGVALALGFVPRQRNALYAGLNKEIWIERLMDGFYPNDAFLTESQDMSEFVDNDKINFAEIGADPDVLVNNTTYPVSIVGRTDTALEITLDYFDTVNTVVRNAEQKELVYNKIDSVQKGHKRSLQQSFSMRAAHAYAPAADAADLPVLVATGGDRGDGTKMLTWDDVITLMSEADQRDWDASPGSRILILNPKHQADLVKQDKALFKEFVDRQTGRVNNMYSFKMFPYSKTPIYNRTTGAKVAFGAAAAPTTDTISSVFYLKTEVMRAQGTIDMFSRLKDPEARGDIMGYQMRGIALPMRAKGRGAIYSPAV